MGSWFLTTDALSENNLLVLVITVFILYFLCSFFAVALKIVFVFVVRSLLQQQQINHILSAYFDIENGFFLFQKLILFSCLLLWFILLFFVALIVRVTQSEIATA